jgi:hypothetical protein
MSRTVDRFQGRLDCHHVLYNAVAQSEGGFGLQELCLVSCQIILNGYYTTFRGIVSIDSPHVTACGNPDLMHDDPAATEEALVRVEAAEVGQTMPKHRLRHLRGR